MASLINSPSVKGFNFLANKCEIFKEATVDALDCNLYFKKKILLLLD
jgi:hypothetical protein